ncbi:hypothetical protein [Phytomonospora endophytica]|uniref:Glycine zipper family protein n=1 Tax=Phytomonospora endophytica TaxID=714109 RepID=A0A841FD48_9ACTN|nr:hypothetical protein [Phytomonospora endophytica]MBB6032933.1 hypothetical protein [Phytomonospora endophytica]GIG65159.1 hypothetical protein Pen01_14540 [Phytomonospora endophytica]
MSYGSDLRAVADAYADDIETADDLARTFLGAPDSLPLPSVVIHGLASVDTEAMRAQILALLPAKDSYGTITSENSEEITLMNRWQGAGADAFGHRWQALATYVNGDSSAAENVSLVSRINAHRDLAIGSDGVSGLVGAVEASQSQCVQYIQQNLKGLRTMWHDQLDLFGGLLGGTVVGGGAGAAIGAPFALVGAIPGAIIGTAVGAVAGCIAGVIHSQSAWTAEIERINQGTTGVAGLDDPFAFNTASITELQFTPGSVSSTELFAPWKPE